MTASLLTNDTRTPPQARILGAAVLAIGGAIVLLAFQPWEDEAVVRGFWFWFAWAATTFLTWLTQSSFKVAEQWERFAQDHTLPVPNPAETLFGR